MLGIGHLDTLEAMVSLADVLLLKGGHRLCDVARLYRTALQHYRLALGPEHPMCMTIVRVLSRLLVSQISGLAEAAELTNELLSYYTRSRGEMHDDTLSTLSTLGFVLVTLPDR